MIPLGIVALAQLFVDGHFIDSFYTMFNILISILLIYCATCQISLCFLAIYLLYIMYPLIQWIMAIGLTLQNTNKYYVNPQLRSKTITALIIGMITIVVLSGSIFLVFLAYREYKAISKGMIEESYGADNGLNYSRMNDQRQQNQQNQQNQQIAGTGGFFGGMYQNDDENNQQRPNQQRGNQGTQQREGFTPFAGRGVTLG